MLAPHLCIEPKNLPVKNTKHSFRLAAFSVLVTAMSVGFASLSQAQTYAELTAPEAHAPSASETSALSLAERFAAAPPPAAMLTRNPLMMLESKKMNPEQYMQKNMRYPESDRLRGNSGHVTVQFDIAPDGRVYGVTALSAPSQTLAYEAVRVIEAMPAWLPALIDSTPVTSRYRLRVAFSLR